MINRVRVSRITKGANIFSDFPKKIGERDLFMKISRVISDVVVFVERVQ